METVTIPLDTYGHRRTASPGVSCFTYYVFKRRRLSRFTTFKGKGDDFFLLFWATCKAVPWAGVGVVFTQLPDTDAEDICS